MVLIFLCIYLFDVVLSLGEKFVQRKVCRLDLLIHPVIFIVLFYISTEKAERDNCVRFITSPQPSFQGEDESYFFLLGEKVRNNE